MTHIALFASGSGTNAENIIKYFKKNEKISVSLIICNKPDAFVLQRAKNHNIPSHIIGKHDIEDPSELIRLLDAHKIGFIVLAGFLWRIPLQLIQKFNQNIVNIHPALLPKYGGKGMYGMRVHESVISNKERESGVTIHYVNENYDEGDIIFQSKCSIESNDTAEALAKKVHEIEYMYFPKIIEQIIMNKA